MYGNDLTSIMAMQCGFAIPVFNTVTTTKL